MEQMSNTSLFSLSIDPVTKAHLSETTRWAKFLAIVGFIFLGLILIAGLVMVATMSTLTAGIEQDTQGFGTMAQYGVGLMAFFYIIMVLIMFFPLLFMLRFANKMRAALDRNDQQQFNVSFQNLK